ncbi:MAG: response regulator [Acidobacteriota bacterium]
MQHPIAPQALVVDDEPLIRWSLSRALRDRGYDVIEAGDGEAAVKGAAQGPAVVLLDLKLPDRQDLDLLAELRGLLPSARFVLMTAFGSPETKARARELGAIAVVEKPFDVRAIVALAIGRD